MYAAPLGTLSGGKAYKANLSVADVKTRKGENALGAPKRHSRGFPEKYYAASKGQGKNGANKFMCKYKCRRKR